MVLEADILPGMSVLEPSAGTGNLLKAIPEGCEVVAVETVPALCDRLKAQGFQTLCADFLTTNGTLGTFDRIIMNPPFENGSDIKHIEHAITKLKPGGRLVAICAGGPRQAEKLRPKARTWEPLPAGTFKESGTMVNTVLMVYEAPGEQPTRTDVHLGGLFD